MGGIGRTLGAVRGGVGRLTARRQGISGPKLSTAARCIRIVTVAWPGQTDLVALGGNIMLSLKLVLS